MVSATCNKVVIFIALGLLAGAVLCSLVAIASQNWAVMTYQHTGKSYEHYEMCNYKYGYMMLLPVIPVPL